MPKIHPEQLEKLHNAQRSYHNAKTRLLTVCKPLVPGSVNQADLIVAIAGYLEAEDPLVKTLGEIVEVLARE